jgi:hypothetical protein
MTDTSLLRKSIIYGIKTFSITTLSVMGLFPTLGINVIHHNNTANYVECRYAECHVISIVMQNVVWMSVLAPSCLLVHLAGLSLFLPSVCLSVCPFVHNWRGISFLVSVQACVSQWVNQYVCLSDHPSVLLSVYLSACSFCLFGRKMYFQLCVQVPMLKNFLRT